VNYTTETHEGKSVRDGAPGTEEIITYTVERGDRHKLVGIEISGNKYFDTDLLRSRLQIFGGAFASADASAGGWWTPTRNRMRDLYQANGFLDPRSRRTSKTTTRAKRAMYSLVSRSRREADARRFAVDRGDSCVQGG